MRRVIQALRDHPINGLLFLAWAIAQATVYFKYS